MTKHFWKTLIIFAVMIIIGLIGVVLVSNLEKGEDSTNTPTNKTEVAK
ncbi:MAG: hypothetical protein NT161_00875 [Candidatus Nomurabacteria bacterium]|nr:hypothetical protein [Candidatus Nomurabacteria bacterium]